MKPILGYVLVFIGAGVGGSLRHAVNRMTLPFGNAFPIGTLFVNVIGSIAMGMLAGLFMLPGSGTRLFAGEAGQHFRLFLTTGLLGGFTTFSAFSLDAAQFIERGRIGIALLYAVASVVLAIGGLFVGLALTRP